jgi:three-Cys-motif partner protein
VGDSDEQEHRDEWGNCTLDSDDGSAVQCVGGWILDKHEYVRRYIEATHGARARYLGPDKGGAAFVDLYAGPGRARIRDTGEFVPGSPFLALDHKVAPFSRVVLCELAEVNLRALSKRIEGEQTRVSLIDGDCNEVIHEIVSAVPVHGLNLAFVDPYNLAALSFETLRCLAKVTRMDLIIHFPTGTIKRNWGKVDDGLDRFLGTTEWRKAAPGGAKDAAKLVDVLREQLTGAGYTGANVRAVPIENKKHARMYHLVFASKHALADKIWNDVTKHKPSGQRGWGF